VLLLPLLHQGQLGLLLGPRLPSLLLALLLLKPRVLLLQLLPWLLTGHLVLLLLLLLVA
jgi:hypothetical protein